MSHITPAIDVQYNAIKSQLNDGTLLLFRVGDFYELYDADAIRASKTLGLHLAVQLRHLKHSRHITAFPYHQLEAYMAKLIKANHKIAIGEYQP